jgi:hypothetical protein
MTEQDPLDKAFPNPLIALDSIRWYFVRILEAISHFINVALFFGGNPAETLSGRCYRCRNDGNTIKPWGILRKVIDFLAWPFHVEHCKKSYEMGLSHAYKLVDTEDSE